MQLASDKHKTFFNNIKNSIYYLQYLQKGHGTLEICENKFNETRHQKCG